MSKEGKARVAVTARTQKETCNSEIHMWLNISIIPTLLLFRQQVMSNSFAPPWTVVWQGPLSMGFPKQEYWSGLPFPSPGDLLNPGIKPVFPALAGRFFTTDSPGKFIPILLDGKRSWFIFISFLHKCLWGLFLLLFKVGYTDCRKSGKWRKVQWK